MSRTKIPRRFLCVGALLIVSALCGCASLIGLEDADPLGAGGASAASSSATDGGSSTSTSSSASTNTGSGGDGSGGGGGGAGGGDPAHFLGFPAGITLTRLAVLAEDKSVLVLGAVEAGTDLDPMCGDLDLAPLEQSSAPILRVDLKEDGETFLGHRCVVHRSLRGETFSINSMVTIPGEASGLPALGLGGTFAASVLAANGTTLITAAPSERGAFALSFPSEFPPISAQVSVAAEGAATKPLAGYGIPRGGDALSFAVSFEGAADGGSQLACGDGVAEGTKRITRTGNVDPGSGDCSIENEAEGRVLDAAPGPSIVGSLTATPAVAPTKERVVATLVRNGESDPEVLQFGTRPMVTEDRDARVHFVPVANAPYFLFATEVEDVEDCASSGPFVASLPLDGSGCRSWAPSSEYTRLIAGVGVGDEIAIAIGKPRSEEADDFELQHLQIAADALEPYAGDEGAHPFCTSCDVRDMAISLGEVWILGVAIRDGDDPPTVMGHEVARGPFLYHAQFEELFP